MLKPGVVAFDVGLRIEPRFRTREFSQHHGVTPAELVDDVRGLTRQVQHIRAETLALLAQVDALDRALIGAPSDVRAALEAVRTQAQNIATS